MVTYWTYAPYFEDKHPKFAKLLIFVLNELMQNEGKLL